MESRCVEDADWAKLVDQGHSSNADEDLQVQLDHDMMERRCDGDADWAKLMAA